MPYPPAYAKINKFALTSMILAIAGIALSMFGGGLLGLAAVALGTIACVQISKNPLRYGGLGYAVTGMSIGTLAVLASCYFLILGPFLVAQQEIKSREVCKDHLRRILQSANVYANDNSDDFPTVMPPKNGVVTFGGGGPSSNTDKTISDYYDKGDQRGNVTACLWVLVLRGYSTPSQFICPNANSTPATDHSSNFPGIENFSYAVAIPWDAAGNRAGYWKNIVDASTPIMADQGPVNGDHTPLGIVDLTNISGNPRLLNSPNHKQQGQVVGYSDGHAEFEFRPDIGNSDDNIWTHNSISLEVNGPSRTGIVPPYGRGIRAGSFSRDISAYTIPGTMMSYDILMAPARGSDGKTY